MGFMTAKICPTCLSYLHDNGADLDAESDYGESPLSVASSFGRFDAIKCLLVLGANELSLGWNLLMKTWFGEQTPSFRTVLNDEEDLGYCDRYGRSAWHLAAFGPLSRKSQNALVVEVSISMRRFVEARQH